MINSLFYSFHFLMIQSFLYFSGVVIAENICQSKDRTSSSSSDTSIAYHDSNGNGRIQQKSNRQTDDASALVRELGEKGVWPEFIVEEIVELLLFCFRQTISRMDVVQKLHYHKQILTSILAFN
jgi:hypothetical protein